VVKWQFVIPVLVMWGIIAWIFFGILAKPYYGQTWQQSLANERLLGEVFLAFLVVVTIGFWLVYRRQVNRGMAVYDYVQGHSGTCLANLRSGDAVGLTADELVVPPLFGSQPRTVSLDAIQRVTVSAIARSSFGGNKYLTEVHQSDGQTLRFFAPAVQLGAMLAQLQAVRPNVVLDGMGLKLVELLAGSLNITPSAQS